MSKNDENNSHLMLKNNSTKNLNSFQHHKNKSSNFLTDSPSTLFTVQLHSLNSNQNSKNNNQEKCDTNNNYNTTNLTTKKSKKNILDTTTNTQKITTQKLHINPTQENNTNSIRIKLSKISSKFSAATPKQNACIYNQIYGVGVEQGNILIKKNLKLADLQKLKNSRNNMTKNNKNLSKNKNNNVDFVKYVNNDKCNFNTNLLNLTQNYSKCLLSQSKSFININKNSSSSSNVNTPNKNNNISNTNIKKNNKNNFNYIYYNNINSDTNENNNNNEINNSIGNKKIYFMKSVKKRKKTINKKDSNEIENINTNPSSICSKDKKDNNIFENNNFLNDLFDKNVNNIEELHFFYVKILQSGNELSKKFEIK